MKTGLKIGLGMIAFISTMYLLALGIWSFVIWDFKPFVEFWDYLYMHGWTSVRVILLLSTFTMLFSIAMGVVEEKD
jgi:hypothetical protein